jgi:hypothetical protein
MNLTLIAAAAAALVAAAATWYVTADHYKGVIAEKDDAQKTALIAAQQKADAKALFAQTQSGLAVAAASAQYEDKLHAQDIQHAGDLAAVRNHTLVLRDNAARCGSDHTEVQPGSSCSGRDDTGGAELSAPATEFLLGEADRADRVVHRLAACQVIVKDDREVIEQLFNQDSK